MTDEARLDRLTEIARRVWPQRRNVRVVASEDAAFVMADVGAQSYPVLSIPHPRGLDALEAALTELAHDEPSLESLAEIPELSPDARYLGRGSVGRAMARVVTQARKVMPIDWRPTQEQVDAARRALTKEEP